MVTVDEFGHAEPEPTNQRPRVNTGVLLRGDADALKELMFAIEEQAELLGVQVVFVKRSQDWLTIVNGKPDDILGNRRGNET